MEKNPRPLDKWDILTREKKHCFSVVLMSTSCQIRRPHLFISHAHSRAITLSVKPIQKLVDEQNVTLAATVRRNARSVRKLLIGRSN